MSNPCVLYSVEGGVARIRLNREERRNALNHEMIEAVLDSLSRAKEDGDVRVVCIEAAGEKYFCAGGDLSGMSGGEEGGADSTMRKYARMIKELARFPKPTVCKAVGSVLGGGLGLMLACDIVLARSDIGIGTPEVNIGIFPMMIGALIYRNAAWKKAMKMILLGEKVSAREAEAMGLVSLVVEPGRFEEEAQRILAELAGKSPIAVKLGKEAFHAMSDMKFEEAVDFLCESLTKVTATEDAFEGISAFMEKRKPVFKGR
jgi:enoyl-CoA hydratase/carnithine racemase